jgi:uncharacterized membrane protein HdeD (DUF308 family)
MSIGLKVVMDNRLRETVIITSIVLFLAGIAAITLPQFMSITIAMFAGWLMVIAGGIALYISPGMDSGTDGLPG